MEKVRYIGESTSISSKIKLESKAKENGNASKQTKLLLVDEHSGETLGRRGRRSMLACAQTFEEDGEEKEGRLEEEDKEGRTRTHHPTSNTHRGDEDLSTSLLSDGESSSNLSGSSGPEGVT